MDEKTALVGRDEARKELLNKCEAQITEGKRKGREAIRMIARALNKIRDEELYLDQGNETFNQYCEQKLGMERWTVQNICKAYDTIKTLEEAGITQIPTIESQLVLLGKIPKEDLAKVWSEGVTYLRQEGLPINTSAIETMVDFALNQAKERPGVEPELNIEEDLENGSVPAVSSRATAPVRASRSEDAEIALERIGRLAGKQTLQAIEKGIIQISDRDLIRWAEQSDQMVKNLDHYIMHELWSVKKALEFEENAFNGQTTLSGLALFATAHGGEYSSEFSLLNATWKFHIERLHFG